MWQHDKDLLEVLKELKLFLDLALAVMVKVRQILRNVIGVVNFD